MRIYIPTRQRRSRRETRKLPVTRVGKLILRSFNDVGARGDLKIKRIVWIEPED